MRTSHAVIPRTPAFASAALMVLAGQLKANAAPQLDPVIAQPRARVGKELIRTRTQAATPESIRTVSLDALPRPLQLP